MKVKDIVELIISELDVSDWSWFRKPGSLSGPIEDEHIQIEFNNQTLVADFKFFEAKVPRALHVEKSLITNKTNVTLDDAVVQNAKVSLSLHHDLFSNPHVWAEMDVSMGGDVKYLMKGKLL